MATVVEATVPVEQFALSETFDDVRGAEFEMVQAVAHGSDRPMPYLCATAGESEALPDAVRRDPSTEDVEVLSQFDGEYLLELDWSSRVSVVLRVLLEGGATLLDATGRTDGWRFRMLFPERDAMSATVRFCEDYGIDIELARITRLSGSLRRGQLGLTENQMTTLASAFDTGYYDVPRKTTLGELADEFDVSHQALSERIRRGHRSLVASTLGTKSPFRGSPGHASALAVAAGAASGQSRRVGPS